METYIFIALICLSLAFIVKVLYFEKDQQKSADAKKPLPISVPADPKYRNTEF
ncbi:MAG: hypothetical protein K0S33_4249 [Bacteroidetes bacterium]|jgi:hypothetical protein|nr:hypothetical protein [Bacteroidota bacterium]